MLSYKQLCLGLVGLALVLGLFVSVTAQPVPPNSSSGEQAASTPLASNEVVQTFPSNGVMETAWKIHYLTQTGSGLIIQDAWFKRSPKAKWMQVLGDARLAEILVPYHSGSPRFWDVTNDFGLCEATAVDAGPHGKLLGNPPNAVMEVRDRGLAWVDSKGPRRGQMLALRGTLRAANYRYVIEFGFQDDGVVNFRVGATGHNYDSREFEPHMHNNIWRVDINLDGPAHNSVYVMEHQEPDDKPEKARTVRKPFHGGKEGGIDWVAEKFTMLHIVNERRKNARGKLIGYDLVSQRMGNARHFGGAEEECTQHDFWVTRNHADEMEYKKVPEYVKNREGIMNTDVVLWVSTPAHHEPRSEDGEMRKSGLHGVTSIMWTGFDLKPRDLFDRTPFYRR